ncbi:translation factor GUF1, mitochondrial isoform X2 [Varanus komodoensis]|uniref:translation factor GUF1, mitochondrial isoform X2 n=1 Tax=Varanus komodoensis TaxID=61221 RepID=UPI001CF7E2F6|nr:translation factor GUF1, mitochondrial isoform X2 [Varanus komodoensis]
MVTCRCSTNMFALVTRAIYPCAQLKKSNHASILSHLCLRKPPEHCATFSRQYRSETGKDAVDMSKFPVETIRNFSIIAHVDHGKSTLADRLLEITGTIVKMEHNKQVLDKLQVERERGITVKAQTASLIYHYKGTNYLLNLIDTPGHVDFNYEVSRSLSACQGVLLVVDANEGIQAQTVANFYLAFEAQLSIIPVINKIDLKHADPERVENQIEKVFDIPKEDCIRVSAKLGTNVEQILKEVIERIPPPSVSTHDPLKALVFDSTFDHFRGVIANIAVLGGEICKGHKISTAHTKKVYEVNEIGILTPDEQPTHKLYAGQVGYLIAGMKDVAEAQIGDTIYLHNQPVEPFPGFKSAKPMVFAGMYPTDQSEYNNLKSAVEKLTLNDSSVTVHRASSLALGAGWRLGFLGLLHMEVFNQRLEQEYNASVVLTSPTVPYKAVLSSAKLIKTRRAVQKDLVYIDDRRVMMKYLFPLNEIVVDFYDALKSLSSGYASFDYEDAGYQSADLVKMNILLNGIAVEELVTIVHKEKAYPIAKTMCERLKDIIPRQLFEIAVQAAIGNKIIARETVKAYRKNVLAKCYGGDITRKMKLLKRQSEGKKKLRKIGNVEIPKDAFISVLKRQPDK